MKKYSSKKVLSIKALVLLMLYVCSTFKVEAKSWYTVFKVAPNDGVSFEIDGKSFYPEPDRHYRFYGHRSGSMIFRLLDGSFKKTPIEKQTEVTIKTIVTEHRKPVCAMSLFLLGSERRNYKFRDDVITLDLNQNIFPPSEQGAKNFLKVIETYPNETVIDIGTGSGILGIAAAKMGSKVWATDIHQDAVSIARHNARINNVKVKVEQANYFGSHKKKFDVIIANLPQEILPLSYTEKINKQLQETIVGGEEGNNIMLDFLTILPHHMHQNSRAYICAYGLTKYASTLNFCVSNYVTRLQEIATVPVKDYVVEHIKYFKELKERNEIVLFKKDGKWKTLLYFLELRPLA